MNAQENTNLVRGAYAAFLRGDMPALLAALSDDVDWQGVVGAGEHVPMRGRRRGRAEVAQFFQSVSENVDFQQFEPREFVAERDKVVALGVYRGTARRTGRTFDSEWVMVFTIRDGKVARFREYMDAGAIDAAY